MKYFSITEDNNITIHASRKEARETNAGVFSTEIQFADLIGPNNQRLIEIWNSLPGVTPVTKFANRKIATQRIWKAIQNLGGPAAAPASEPEAAAEIAAPVAQPPQPEPAPQNVAPPAISERSIPAAEQQPEPAAASQEQEPSVASAEAAQQTTPFDEPVATVGAGAAQVALVEAKTSKKASRAKKAPTGETNAGAPREGSKTSQVIAMLKREGGTTLEEIMSVMNWQKHTTRALLSAGGSLTKKHGLVVASQKVGDKRTYSIKA
jgi:hypothetical protein